MPDNADLTFKDLERSFGIKFALEVMSLIDPVWTLRRQQAKLAAADKRTSDAQPNPPLED